MRILAVGGAGYVGCKLVPLLCERGYDVTVVDWLFFGNNLDPKVNVIKKDFFTLKEDDLKGFDQVIFLAGLSNDPMAEFAPADNFVYNAAGPAYLALIAKNAGVKRFIFASSCSVYGYTNNELYGEESIVNVSFPYGISKLQGEKGVMHLKDDKFSVIALRKGTICGYSPRMRFDLVINTMFKNAILKSEITVNNPTIWRPILSINDACSAYVRAVEACEDISGIFNVASFNCTVGSMADDVKNCMEKVLNKKLHVDIKHNTDFRNYKVSIEKANNILSFFPKNSIEDIVNDLCDNMNKYDDLNLPNYYNIEVFKEWKKSQSSEHLGK